MQCYARVENVGCVVGDTCAPAGGEIWRQDAQSLNTVARRRRNRSVLVHPVAAASFG